MAIKNDVVVTIQEKFVKNQVHVDVRPVNPLDNMNAFFKQFKGKKVRIIVEDLTPTCGNRVCMSAGVCQGHWTEEELKASEAAVEAARLKKEQEDDARIKADALKMESLKERK